MFHNHLGGGGGAEEGVRHPYESDRDVCQKIKIKPLWVWPKLKLTILK